MNFAAVMLAACLIDAFIGWPDRLYQRIGHPVTWIGSLTGWLEGRFNKGSDREQFWRGMMTVGLVVGLVTGVTAGVQAVLPQGWPGILLAGALAWPLMVLRSMHNHVAAVMHPLARGDLSAARLAVSMIVGRDPNQLDAAGLARAALESLAENTSDGIVAPVFWGVIAGLPGIAAYKAINTLDSMIGHRNQQYEHFGKVAARLDDLVNLIPARLTGLLFVLVSGNGRTALSVMLRDARHHRSPNAGWPEAAMAGALNVRLSGPRVYGDRFANEPWLNAGAPDPNVLQLQAGLGVYCRTIMAMSALLALWVWMVA